MWCISSLNACMPAHAFLKIFIYKNMSFANHFASFHCT